MEHRSWPDARTAYMSYMILRSYSRQIARSRTLFPSRCYSCVTNNPLLYSHSPIAYCYSAILFDILLRMKARVLLENLRRVLWARIEAGELTGLRLAEQTGFKQAHISNFLNRKRGLSL